ncbi:unnamed protein product, partial [Medioppia subpectinata]
VLIVSTGDTVVTRPRYKHRSVVVPKGHCWVEGDNADKSMDSFNQYVWMRAVRTDICDMSVHNMAAEEVDQSGDRDAYGSVDCYVSQRS